MAKVVISAQQFAGHIARLGRDFIPAAQRGMKVGALRCVAFLQERTRQAPPANPGKIGSGGAVNTGAYLRAWKSQELPGGNGVLVTNDSVYAAIIEHGRRAGSRMPPLGLIEDWVIRRLRVKRGAQSRGLAFVIARAIAQRGLLGRKIMTGGLPRMKQLVEAEIRDALDIALRARP